MKIFQEIRERFKSDSGDGVLMIAIVSIPLLVICMGLGIDLNRAVMMKQEVTNTAQEVATKIAKNVDTGGSIRSASVYPVSDDHAGHAGLWYKKTSSKQMNATRTGECKTVEVGASKTKRPAPYIEVTISESRGSSSSAPGKMTFHDETMLSNTLDPDPQKTYRVAKVEVWDSSKNFFGIFGLNACNNNHVSVSGISFGSNADLG